MKRIALTVISALCALVATAQSIKVDVQNLVGLDETFNVTFSIEGTEDISDFNWSPGEDFQLVWGPSTSTSHSYQMINGRSSSSTQKSWTYVLKPLREGSFQIGSATAKVGGNTVRSSIATVQVLANGAPSGSGRSANSNQGAQSRGNDDSRQSRGASQVSGDDIFLRLAVSKRSAVVGEPLTVTLKLYTRLQITGFDDLKLPVFNGFWSQDLDNISQISFDRESYDNMIYNSAVIRNYVIIPQQSGTLTIDPAELVCIVAIHNNSGGNSIFDSLFDDYTQVRKRLSTAPVKVDVSPLPSGAPSSFSGAVGSYRMTASLSKDEIKTNDAATLKITVSGNGNLSLLDTPKVRFPMDFESYDPEVTTNASRGGTSGDKVFEIPFIARTEGEYTIDPVEFTFYDTATRRYETLRSDPLHINVLKGDAAAAASSPRGQETAPSFKQSEVKSLGEDISFIKTGDGKLRDKGSFVVRKGWYWALLAMMLVAAALYLLIRSMLLKSRSDVVRTRSRRATKMALRRLSDAKACLGRDDRTGFYTELHNALNGFAADRLSLDMTDMSKENIAENLSSRGVSDTLVDSFTSLLDECEFARYAPSGDSSEMKTHYDKAVSVISSIASGIKKSGRPAALMLLLPLMLLGSFEMSAQDPWPEGEKAYAEGRYEDAMDAWTSILEEGKESAELYYNIGNAAWRTGDKAHAILAYERALKLDPSFDDARDNLAYVNARITDSFSPDSEFFLVTFLRKFCYIFTSNVWAWCAAGFLALLMFLLVVFLTSGSRGWKMTSFIGGFAALLLFVFSLSFSLWQSNGYFSEEYGIVTSPVTSVKSSPGADSKDLFLLHEGTKVRYSGSKVEDWAEISIPDGRKGWISSSSAEVI